MDITTNDGDNFPCQCHLSQYAYDDRLCPECEAMEAARADQRQQEAEEEEFVQDPAEPEDDPEMCMAEGNANPDEEPECCDNQYFADACGMMSQDDWDADNDWLASAGWGEM